MLEARSYGARFHLSSKSAARPSAQRAGATVIGDSGVMSSVRVANPHSSRASALSALEWYL